MKFDALKKTRSWRWQFAHRLQTAAAVRRLFPDFQEPEGWDATIDSFAFALTPYYASLIRRADSSDPLFNMVFPGAGETAVTPGLHPDPLNEDARSPVPGALRRYPDRAVVLATSVCAAYCRHCDRKRLAGKPSPALAGERLQRVAEFLRATPEIKDVIISGGDPFTLPTRRLREILEALRSVPSVEVVRIGTRTPVVMPQRVTKKLVRTLREFRPLYVNTQFNHPNELTQEAERACARLVDAGIPMGNQSVLLKGVNDNSATMEALCRGLLRFRVRPYYVFLCEPVTGNSRFLVEEADAVKLMRSLRGKLSGLAIPLLVKDTPDRGKIPLQ